jgi:hypothetical protein
MKKLTGVIIALALFALAISTLDAAVAGRWRSIGSRTVTDRVDHDVIKVGARGGEWSAIRIMVKKRGVQFRDVKVHFANGGVQDVELRDVIPAGGSSRVIDLNGGRRVIDRLEFRYDAQSLGGKAIVSVLGRR